MAKKVLTVKDSELVAKNYVLNLDKIFQFVFDESINRNNESEITEIYAIDDDTSEMNLVNKQLREVRNNDLSQVRTLKYDFLKNLIDSLSQVDAEGEIPLSFGEKLAINTLITNDFLTEKQ